MDGQPANAALIRAESSGLAMSGGGFRSTLFQIGCAWRMYELGLLAGLDVISGVSGGAITAAWLLRSWDELHHGPPESARFAELIAAPLMHFCSSDLDGHEPSSLHRLAGGLNKPFRSQLWERRLRRLFGDEMLSSLAAEGRPRLIVLATNLPTGAAVELGSDSVRESSLGTHAGLSGLTSIARAIAASSAFPGWFRPLVKDVNPEGWVPADDLEGEALDLWAQCVTLWGSRLLMADGGMVDNLAVSAIWDECQRVYISDASAGRREAQPAAAGGNPRSTRVAAGGQLSKLARGLPPALLPAAAALDRALGRYRLLADCLYQYSPRGQAQIRLRLSESLETVRQGAYWRISSKPADYEEGAEAPGLKYARLARLRTSLNHFTESEQRLLINWGYLLADSALRPWKPAGAAEATLPFSESL